MGGSRETRSRSSLFRNPSICWWTTQKLYDFSLELVNCFIFGKNNVKF